MVYEILINVTKITICRSGARFINIYGRRKFTRDSNIHVKHINYDQNSLESDLAHIKEVYQVTSSESWS